MTILQSFPCLYWHSLKLDDLEQWNRMSIRMYQTDIFVPVFEFFNYKGMLAQRWIVRHQGIYYRLLFTGQLIIINATFLLPITFARVLGLPCGYSYIRTIGR